MAILDDEVGFTGDKLRVLEALEAANGQGVADLYGKTQCMVHSRIAELRRLGYCIESKRFGYRDYRYRLVPHE
jgi:hypothetical protein